MIREKTKHLSYSYVTSPVPLFEEQERQIKKTLYQTLRIEGVPK